MKKFICLLLVTTLVFCSISSLFADNDKQSVIDQKAIQEYNALVKDSEDSFNANFIPKEKTEKYLKDVNSAKTIEELTKIEEKFNKDFKDKIKEEKPVYFRKNDKGELNQITAYTAELPPKIGDVKIVSSTVLGWGSEQIANMTKPTLSDYTSKILINIATAFLKPAQSIAYSLVGMLPQEEQIKYQSFQIVNKNGYNLNKKTVQVYSSTITGNTWVTYVIAYQRKTELISVAYYFINGRATASQPKNYGWVKTYTGMHYTDDAFLKTEAKSLYIMGMSNPEIYNFENGTKTNNTSIVIK